MPWEEKRLFFVRFVVMKTECSFKVQYTVVDGWSEALMDIDEIFIACSPWDCTIKKIGVSTRFFL